MYTTNRVEKLREDIKCLFTPDNTPTHTQLWALTKLCKYVRLRARNTSAFNNLFNQLFSGHASFTQVLKTRTDNTSYMGLKITMKDGTQQPVDSEDGEEE